MTREISSVAFEVGNAEHHWKGASSATERSPRS